MTVDDKGPEPLVKTIYPSLVHGHGLFYVYRDGTTVVTLVGEDSAPRPMLVPRPERDVLIALLHWVIEELESDG